MKKKIVFGVIIVILLVAWLLIAYTDYRAVAISYDKPHFCIASVTADDGGSGKYVGLGYSFYLEGHMDADNGYQVDKYTYKIFGITVKQGEANPEKG